MAGWEGGGGRQEKEEEEEKRRKRKKMRKIEEEEGKVRNDTEPEACVVATPQPRDSQSHVHLSPPSEVEGVQSHLRGRFTYRLERAHTHEVMR